LGSVPQTGQEKSLSTTFPLMGDSKALLRRLEPQALDLDIRRIILHSSLAAGHPMIKNL
jgi:hypothetical protein